MAGGLRFEVHRMPQRMRDKVVSQVLEKIQHGGSHADTGKCKDAGCLFEDCLRWSECEGTDPECPYQKEELRMPWERK